MSVIRVFEAFAGYGSQSLALERLREDFPGFDFENVGISEIDKFALKAYEALHGKVTNYVDISKIDWAEVPDFDLFTYSFPCFVKDTLILTNKGYKNIQSVTRGDKVLTHKNRFCDVATPMKRKYKGILYDIDAMASGNIVCTENHPFLVRRKFRHYDHGRQNRIFGNPEWVKSKHLDKSCYLGYAINQVREMPKWDGVIDNRWGHGRISNRLSSLFGNRYFWYLMGRYVGDGWKKNSDTGSGIIICCSDRNKQKLLNAITHIGFKYTISDERTVCKVIISSNELNKFVDRYGYYAYGKRIDVETMNLPVDMLRGFLDGIMDSDGYVDGKGLRKVSSVSRVLVYGLGQCIAKAYHRPFSIYKTKRNKVVTIEGRECNQRDTYTITFKIHDDKQDKAFYEDGYIWFPIRSITCKEDECHVYNMSIESDESYTANGCIVHNCTDISSAGRQGGLSEGSGTRSSLLWECRKAIHEKRPKYLLMENVKALLSDKFRGDIMRWHDELSRLGYSSFIKVLNAKDYGVPQNRERVFMVSVMDFDGMFHFPKKMNLRKKLCDILQPISEIQQKLFLTDKALAMVMRRTGVNQSFKPKPFVNKRTDCVSTLTANYWKTPHGAEYVDEWATLTSRRTDEMRKRRHDNPESKESFKERELVPRKDGISNTLTTHSNDNILVRDLELVGASVLPTSRKMEFKGEKSIYHDYSPALRASDQRSPHCVWYRQMAVRKFSTREYFRLMGLRDDDIDKIQDAGISDSQQYKMAGNSIVVDVLYHIFRKMFIERGNEDDIKTLW